MKPFDPDHQPLSGFQVIEASAGCGKTFALSGLFLRLLTETDIKAEEILVVTFTDAAAAELKTRIRERIQTALNFKAERNEGDNPNSTLQKLRSALSQMDNAPISTIHGFCRQTLLEQAFESGIPFRSVLEADTRALFDEIAYDFYVKNTVYASERFTEYLDIQNVGPESLASLLKTVSGRRGLLVLPDPKPVSDPSSSFLEAYSSAKAHLAADRAGIETALFAADIDRRTYRRDFVSNRLDRLRDIFLGTHPTLSIVNDDLARFTSPMLREKTRSGPVPAHPFIDAADSLVEAELGFCEMLVQFKRRFVDESLAKLDRIKKERLVHTFDDLLQTLHAALEGPFAEPLKAALRARFKAVLIDEFQDTDSIQFDIFNRAFGGGNVPFFVIGDPKQSIYRFRGGDIYTYLKAVHTAKDRRFGLATNWRSDPSVVKAVNTLFSTIKNPFFLDEIPFTPVSSRPGAQDLFPCNDSQGALEIRFVRRAELDVGEDKPIPASSAEDKILHSLTADVKSLLGKQDDTGVEITPSRIAVLVRTNEQARAVRDTFVQSGIAAVLLKEESVYESEEALEMRLLLRAVQNPTDLTALRNGLSTRLFGLTASTIRSLFEDPDEIGRWSILMSSLRRTLLKSGIFSVLRAVLDFEIGSQTRAQNLLRSQDGDRAITNYRHLAELIEKYLKGGGATGEGLNLWLDRQCERAREGLTDGDDTELRIRGDAEGVRVLTVHKSKGLEFDIVFCPYLWNASADRKSDSGLLFHDPKSGRLTLALSEKPDDAHLLQERFEIEAEGVRLAYVALTRAKRRCLVITGAFKSLNASPLGRLFHGTNPSTSGVKSDDELLSDLMQLSTQSGGAVRVSSLFSPLSPLSEKSFSSASMPLSSRQFTGRIPAPLATTSFTGLVSAKPISEQDDDEDEDELSLSEGIENEGAGDGGAGGDRGMSLITFDRGAAAGTCLHTILEALDFEEPTIDPLTRNLRDFGFQEEWASPLFADMCTLLSKPLLSREEDLSLGRISKSRRQSELSFLFPLKKTTSLPQSLSKLFLHYRAKGGTGYAKALAALPPLSLSGYMRGFIDLVFEHRGRYFIVDYKSNFLGDTVRHYHPSAVEKAMAKHHYYLQYHIYAVALHRRLDLVLKEYSYEKHFGGVFYLFLRGMTGHGNDLNGIFFDRPKESFIEGISKLFGGEAPESERQSSENINLTPQEASRPQLALPGFGFEPDETGDKKRTSRGRRAKK